MENSCEQLRYPVGIQSFAKLREEGFVYVDKTEMVYNLVKNGGYHFLSRPRRFGKSLLLSTIEAYFSGRRDLFKGLAIDSLTEDWTPRPILHLDLNNREYSGYESLIKELSSALEKWEALYGDEKHDRDVEERFAYIIEKAHQVTGQKAVILIDEYDKPLLAAIGDEALSERFRNTLKAFYGNLKSLDAHIEFAILTGVARFGKVSIFSDLNNLRDITFDPAFSAICGVTNEEIDRYFDKGLRCLAQRYDKTYDDVRLELKRRYDGYHFARDLRDIYNPFSLMNVFASNLFDNYWFKSGTPTYIVKLLRNSSSKLHDLEGMKIKSIRLGVESITDRDPIASLYQTGYLTIKEYSEKFDRYTLGYPNDEVEESFIDFLYPYYIGRHTTDSEFDIEYFINDIQDGNPQAFMTRLDSLLRGVPHIGSAEPHEIFFQNAIYLIFKILGFYTRMEDHTSNGRIDLTVDTDRHAYVFEFKVNSSASMAMEQILEKKYWKKFEASGKTIHLIAANFNTSERALDDIIIDTIQSH